MAPMDEAGRHYGLLREPLGHGHADRVTVLKSWPQNKRGLALSGRVVIDTFRGRIRIRKWPRKQSAAHKRKNRDEIERFRLATQLMKYLPGDQVQIAQQATKGTPLYPRDLLMMAARGNLFDELEVDGQIVRKETFKLRPVMFQGTIVRPVVPQSIGTSPTTVTWASAMRDSLGAFDPGEPNKLSLPAGLDIIRVDWKMHTHISSGNRYRIPRLLLDGEVQNYGKWSTPDFSRTIYGTDFLALLGEPADLTFTLQYQQSGLLPDNIPSMFAVTVLQTSP